MVKLNAIVLPEQTLFSAEHSSNAGVTDVAHTLTGKPVVFGQKLLSRPATLEFNADLAWLNPSQHDALLQLSRQLISLSLTVRGVDYVAILNHSATDGAVVLTPLMPFADRFSGVVNLIILES